MSVYRIEAVQKALGETVAQSDYDGLQSELNKITLKYRDLLEKENHLVAKSAAIELLQVSQQQWSLYFQPAFVQQLSWRLTEGGGYMEV